VAADWRVRNAVVAFRSRTILWDSSNGHDRANDSSARRKGEPMPLYIDFHAKMPSLPQSAFDEMRKQMGQVDKNGVNAVGADFTKDGQAYCISEAPDADAVCKMHEAKGLKLDRGEVHEVSQKL
jgi:hypothetical protein